MSEAPVQLVGQGTSYEKYFLKELQIPGSPARLPAIKKVKIKQKKSSENDLV